VLNKQLSSRATTCQAARGKEDLIAAAWKLYLWGPGSTAPLKNWSKEDLLAATWDELGAWVLDSSSPFKNRSKEDLLTAAWDDLGTWTRQQGSLQEQG
jgi:hypothetical protein